MHAIGARILWFKSARIEVPDNIDTVQGLQRIGYWNAGQRSLPVLLHSSGRLMFWTTIESAQQVHRAIAQQTAITMNKRFNPFVYCKEVWSDLYGVGS
jgi:hypothetical protein